MPTMKTTDFDEVPDDKRAYLKGIDSKVLRGLINRMSDSKITHKLREKMERGDEMEEDELDLALFDLTPEQVEDFWKAMKKKRREDELPEYHEKPEVIQSYKRNPFE